MVINNRYLEKKRIYVNREPIFKYFLQFNLSKKGHELVEKKLERIRRDLSPKLGWLKEGDNSVNSARS